LEHRRLAGSFVERRAEQHAAIKRRDIASARQGVSRRFAFPHSICPCEIAIGKNEAGSKCVSAAPQARRRHQLSAKRGHQARQEPSHRHHDPIAAPAIHKSAVAPSSMRLLAACGRMTPARACNAAPWQTRKPIGWQRRIVQQIS
jgi:hypothetical protein